MFVSTIKDLVNTKMSGFDDDGMTRFFHKKRARGIEIPSENFEQEVLVR